MKKRSMDELGRMTPEAFKAVGKLPVCLVLDNVRSMHNVGSAFRSADAFRIEKLYLTGITGTPPHREINKTALGATETVAWEYFPTTEQCLEQLKAAGYAIILIEQTTTSANLAEFNFTSFAKIALVFGNEVEGVSDSALGYADAAIEIPQEGTKHSLNISVCVGILAWECFRQFLPSK